MKNIRDLLKNNYFVIFSYKRSFETYSIVDQLGFKRKKNKLYISKKIIKTAVIIIIFKKKKRKKNMY